MLVIFYHLFLFYLNKRLKSVGMWAQTALSVPSTFSALHFRIVLGISGHKHAISTYVMPLYVNTFLYVIVFLYCEF